MLTLSPYGISWLYRTSCAPNENLKPQNQSSFEVGADLRFSVEKLGDVHCSTGYFANNINTWEDCQ